MTQAQRKFPEMSDEEPWPVPAPGKRLPVGLVTEEVAQGGSGQDIDWSCWYLTDEEDMGESTEQGAIVEELLSALREWAAERRWSPCTYVGSDQFFAWVEVEPLVRISPDIYLIDLEKPPEPPVATMWQTWLPGHPPPRFALEVVSDDWRKDYRHNPPKYSQLGTRELVIFDAEAALMPPQDLGQRRLALQVYRRGADGVLRRVYAGAGPVFSEELQCHLAVERRGPVARLRLARDAAGTDWVPTTMEARRRAEQARENAEVERAQAKAERIRAEAGRAQAEAERLHAETERAHAETKRAQAEAERVQAEAERAQAEAERAQAEAERQKEIEAREKAEARIRELEQQLAQLRS